MTDQPPPLGVYLDTSVVVSAMFEGIRLSEPSAAFCADLANRGGRAFFSQILRLELSQTLAKLAYDTQLPLDLRRRYRLDRWQASAQIREEWMAFGLRQFADFTTQFDEVLELPFDISTWETSVDIMAQAQL